MRGPAAMKQASSASLIRERKDGSGARVGSVELFFDLVFVFAAHSYRISCYILTPLGAVQTCLLLMAVWWELMTQSGHSAPHRQGIIPPIERGEFGPRRRHPLPPLPRRAWWNPRGYRRWRTHRDGWSTVADKDGR